MAIDCLLFDFSDQPRDLESVKSSFWCLCSKLSDSCERNKSGAGSQSETPPAEHTQGYNVAGIVIGFLLCIPYTFTEGLLSTQLFDSLPKALAYLEQLMRGLELGNILITLVIVGVALKITRSALSDNEVRI